MKELKKIIERHEDEMITRSIHLSEQQATHVEQLAEKLDVDFEDAGMLLIEAGLADIGRRWLQMMQGGGDA